MLKVRGGGGEKSKGGIYRFFIFQSHAHPHSAPCTSLGGIINNLTKCWSTTRSWRGKRAQNQLSGRSHCHHEPQQRISLPSKTDAQKEKQEPQLFIHPLLPRDSLSLPFSVYTLITMAFHHSSHNSNERKESFYSMGGILLLDRVLHDVDCRSAHKRKR